MHPGSGVFTNQALADDSTYGYCSQTGTQYQVILALFCAPATQQFGQVLGNQTHPSMAVIPAHGWPVDYANNVLVAYPGSKNDGQPTGYKIVRYRFDKNKNLISRGKLAKLI